MNLIVAFVLYYSFPGHSGDERHVLCQAEASQRAWDIRHLDDLDKEPAQRVLIRSQEQSHKDLVIPLAKTRLMSFVYTKQLASYKMPCLAKESQQYSSARMPVESETTDLSTRSRPRPLATSKSPDPLPFH